MTTIAQQVSRAIRILRGNRDESARASHLVVEKDLLMTYETDLLGQAETEKYSQSTFFERKSMSTKTAFKRVALVAAAALAIGGFSAVEAQAAFTNLAITTATTGAAVNSIAATQIAGPANFVTVTNFATVTATTGSVYFTITGGATTSGATSGTVAGGSATFNVATPTVGTITVTGYAITSGAAATTATDTLTITVVAALPGTVYGSSTVFGNTAATATPITADGTFPIVAPANGSAAANFTLTETDGAGNALTAGWKGITATSTNGLLTSTGGVVIPAGTTYIAGTPTTAVTNFVLSSINGLAGTSTVTFSVNGVVVKTYSVTFTGAAAKIVATVIQPVIAVGNPANVTANTNAIKVQEFDSNGNAIAIANPLTITAGTTTVLSSTAFGATATSGTFADGSTISSTAEGISLTGVAAGTSTLTVTDATAALTSAPVSVRVSAATPTIVVISSDAAAYPAGGAGKIITTVSDSAGTLPAGTYAVFTGQETSSLALAVGTLAGGAPVAPAVAPVLGSIVVKDDGTNTVAFNGPLSDGTVTVSATAAATTITVTPATFTVSSGSTDAANAATDAANEATDAANAATDAANAAADSADAATQAAQDASDQAAAALAAVTALSQQVTDLSAKIAALGASLAKITATLAKVASKVKA